MISYIGTAVTDIGISKQTNQDSVCLKIVNTRQYGQVVMAIVCDGLGGLAKGELASATVIRSFEQWFEKEFPQLIGKTTWNELADIWCRRVRELNYKILEYGKQNGGNLGTTFSGMLIFQEEYMIVHVGDTRVYRIANTVEQLTKDQTFIQREMDRGTMTLEQAMRDSRRNMLLQCVGASKSVDPEIQFGKITPNTVYMLCSDGFRHEISTEEMMERFSPKRVRTIDVMHTGCMELVELVKTRRERDNISVGLIKCIG